MELYYMASQLQHAVHWLDDNDNWEKRLLAGTYGETPKRDT